MPRTARIEYEDALYHVMARGNHGGRIFRDDTDRRRFIETLGEACLRTGAVVYSYVLMGNHYHLLIRTPNANLVVMMKWLQGTFTVTRRDNHVKSGEVSFTVNAGVMHRGTRAA